MKNLLPLLILCCSITVGTTSHAASDSNFKSTKKAKNAQRLTSNQSATPPRTLRCKVSRISVTDSGIGFVCESPEARYLVTTNGGNLPGGISAAMSLLIRMADQPGRYRNVRVKKADSASTKICGLIMGAKGVTKSGLECVKSLSFSFAHNDSAISTGSAKPTSIPTQPARPDN